MLETFSNYSVFPKRTIVLVGVPGAFTPVVMELLWGNIMFLVLK